MLQHHFEHTMVNECDRMMISQLPASTPLSTYLQSQSNARALVAQILELL